MYGFSVHGKNINQIKSHLQTKSPVIKEFLQRANSQFSEFSLADFGGLRTGYDYCEKQYCFGPFYGVFLSTGNELDTNTLNNVNTALEVKKIYTTCDEPLQITLEKNDSTNKVSPTKEGIVLYKEICNVLRKATQTSTEQSRAIFQKITRLSNISPLLCVNVLAMIFDIQPEIACKINTKEYLIYEEDYPVKLVDYRQSVGSDQEVRQNIFRVEEK